MLVFLLLGIAGAVSSPTDVVPLLFLQLLGLIGAGYVAGRLAGRDPILHGGLSGLVLFVITTAITVAADPTTPHLAVIAFTGLLAVVLGSVGGALATATHR